MARRDGRAARGRAVLDRGRELSQALRRGGIPDVSCDTLTRSLYSSDASLYRVEPLAVVAPRTRDELEGALAVARGLGVPVTLRGTGTSIAGNAIGAGLVIDTRRHLDRILDLDTQAGTAIVEPGVVHATLQARARAAGWRYGPDPSTHDRCTIGGMVGNNACGTRALGYGRTSDNLLGVEAVTGAGERFVAGDLDGSPVPPRVVDTLRVLTDQHLGLIRTTFGRFPRQISGYALEHLLPENGRHIARLLAGSEGTLAVATRIEVALVRDAPARLLVVLGFPSMPEAADAVPAVLTHDPVACEGLDRRIVDAVRQRRGPAAVPDLPAGSGWLLVEFAGQHPDELMHRATALIADAAALDARVVTDPAAAAQIWRIREAGAGLAARTPAGAPAHAGWEDAAVPPARLGGYLRAFDELLDSHGLSGLPYGHFGDGCLHIRIDFPLEDADGPAVMRSFVQDAADLAVAHGGSLSGEHGDGRARSQLLARMYPPEALALMAAVKHTFDPDGHLNPGIIVDPAPLDAALRQPVTGAILPTRQLVALSEDAGSLLRALHRCTGVGACLTDRGDIGSVMCPSHIATGAEKDGTRGRARVLQDAVAGHLGPRGLGADEVHEALELCLACKGCRSDCPTGTDIATYKTIALAQRYRRRLRPRHHLSLGWMPLWLALTRMLPGGVAVANAIIGRPGWAAFAARVAGLEPGRRLPRLAPHGPDALLPRGAELEAVLFVDTFTDAFDPHLGAAAARVLREAGVAVTPSPRGTCCGLTWVTTGQLGIARRVVSRTVRALERAGDERPIVVLEPSCASALRTDAVELVPEDLRAGARRVAVRVRSLAELLAERPGWQPPELHGLSVVTQTHCHEHATGDPAAELRLLRRAGAEVTEVGGCCGMAGSFGFEPGHGQISRAIAGQRLAPAIQGQGGAGVVLADGFSCRTQVADVSERRAVHLAELLDVARAGVDQIGGAGGGGVEGGGVGERP